MTQINIKRMILGGLLAGLALNIGESIVHGLILGEQWVAASKALNLGPISATVIAGTVVINFVVGFATVWLYTAIRPRYGAGPKTAIYGALAVWILVYLAPTISFILVGLYPAKLLLIALFWGFFELPIISIAGAWYYREE